MSRNRLNLDQNYPVIEKSTALLARAEKLIPTATQTLAKGPGQYVRGVAPVFIEKAKGAHVWDVDGNEYLDFNMGIGPISLGYSYDKVDEAIKAQLAKGITFSLMHPLEVEVAELLHSIVPNAESVRYSKTGADVTSCAVRLARAFTGRNKVVGCGYHGWHDWYIALTDRNRGIPTQVQELTTACVYNDISSVKTVLDEDTACVILEPMLFEEPKNGFLQELKDLCKKNGTLLIFDEMWTGFRLALGGAQERFDVKADLFTYSKAIANGMPISVLAGRSDVMSLLEKDVFFFTTFGGEALSLAAAKATMEEMRDKKVCEHIDKLGSTFKEKLNTTLEKQGASFLKCVGAGARTFLTLSPDVKTPLEAKSLIQQELIRRGIIWTGQHVVSFSHTPLDLDYTVSAYEDLLPMVVKAQGEGDFAKYLKGKPVEPVFRTVTGNLKKK